MLLLSMGHHVVVVVSGNIHHWINLSLTSFFRPQPAPVSLAREKYPLMCRTYRAEHAAHQFLSLPSFIRAGNLCHYFRVWQHLLWLQVSDM